MRQKRPQSAKGSSCELRAVTAADNERVARIIAERWGSEIVVAHGAVYRPADLPGFIAYEGDDWLGLITYHVSGLSCEIVTLDSLFPSHGVGTALVAAVKEAAQAAGCRRLWLVTTNDNLNALRFYQKRGFFIAAVHRNALERSRELKPEIPEVGAEGIPLRDEIELELLLPDADRS